MNKEGESFKRLIEEFSRVGRVLFTGGLNNSHSGNLSVRLGDRVVITRRGAMLGELSADDLVDVGLIEDDSGIALASTEVKVHRAVFAATSHLAIVHTHPRTATALSMGRDFLVPVDDEGRYYFKRIPVLAVRASIGSDDLERELPAMLKDYPIVMVRGHGAFAVGGNLEEGLQITHALEWSCDILLRCLALGMTEEDLMDDRTHGEW
ncbi:MAG: class II aldolase/adducin family protein [bacterium]|nr:class II aldolase/adducin family protein [bacterium]MDT8366895.1 class II aldolase/adducin family protein [bacterium]